MRYHQNNPKPLIHKAVVWVPPTGKDGIYSPFPIIEYCLRNKWKQNVDFKVLTWDGKPGVGLEDDILELDPNAPSYAKDRSGRIRTVVLFSDPVKMAQLTFEIDDSWWDGYD